MRGLALAALLLRLAPATEPGAGPGAVPQVPAAGPFKWHFFPLHVLSGQVKVTCGGGFVVEWFVQVGDYVKEGDPICETCPHAGTSITCTAPASGQVVAEQPLGPRDDALAEVPDGVLAVIQPSGKPRALRSSSECHAVECEAGVTFGQFLVGTGDFVHQGDVVALALTAEGTMDHCRAPVDGRASLAVHIGRGQDMAGLEPQRTVGCVRGSGPPHGRAAALTRPALLLVWAAAGLAATGSLLLGALVLCGKSQTRSLYMLMQDSREDVSKGLRVDFRDGSGCEKSFCFESQPLGIVFSKQTPVRVERFEFNSYAKDRGVQLGWTIARIAQQEITGQHSPPDVDRMLHGHVKTLAFWPLRVDFDTGNGAIKAFYFVKQPLGIEITRHAPFRIALFKPDSYARTCGVQLGWVIVRVGDAVVNQRTSFGALSAYFESGLSHLPQEPKGLRMDFSDPATGKERVFYFQRRPLGLVLTRYKPVRVQGFEFNSYARERGVQAGWTVARIGDQAVPSGLSSEQVDRRILENSATLAVWPLRMDFDTGRGVRTFYFEKQPLGMELLNKLPIRVDTFKPDSYAKACGVQLGWAITRVGDHEVTRETRFEQVIECLVEGVCELPPADATRPPGRGPGVQRGPRSSAC